MLHLELGLLSVSQHPVLPGIANIYTVTAFITEAIWFTHWLPGFYRSGLQTVFFPVQIFCVYVHW